MMEYDIISGHRGSSLEAYSTQFQLTSLDSHQNPQWMGIESTM